MSGNVWEWCEDYWHDSYKNAPSDGSAWLTKNDDNYHISHIIRGGCWGLDPGYCRSASRARSGGGFLAVSLGFRVVCVPTVTSTQLPIATVTPTPSPNPPSPSSPLPPPVSIKSSPSPIPPQRWSRRKVLINLGLVTAGTVASNIFVRFVRQNPTPTPPSPRPSSSPSVRLTNITPFTENLFNGVTLEMVSLPAGEFLMGSPDSDPDALGASHLCNEY